MRCSGNDGNFDIILLNPMYVSVRARARARAAGPLLWQPVGDGRVREYGSFDIPFDRFGCVIRGTMSSHVSRVPVLYLPMLSHWMPSHRPASLDTESLALRHPRLINACDPML